MAAVTPAEKHTRNNLRTQPRQVNAYVSPNQLGSQAASTARQAVRHQAIPPVAG